MKGRRFVVAALTALLLVGACSDRRSDEPRGSIAVDAVEFQFRPLTWTVAAGRSFSVELRNRGTVAHDWTVLRRGTDIRASSQLTSARVLVQVGPVTPGADRSMQLSVPDAGTYQVVCTVPGHLDAGMRAKLRAIEVEAAEAAVAACAPRRRVPRWAGRGAAMVVVGAGAVRRADCASSYSASTSSIIRMM